ncbi:hypothetical protein LCGC14_2843700, partial [marine sediment metagenome]
MATIPREQEILANIKRLRQEGAARQQAQDAELSAAAARAQEAGELRKAQEAADAGEQRGQQTAQRTEQAQAGQRPDALAQLRGPSQVTGQENDFFPFPDIAGEQPVPGGPQPTG